MSVTDSKSGEVRTEEYPLDSHPSDLWFLFRWVTGERQQFARSEEVIEWIIVDEVYLTIWECVSDDHKELIKKKNVKEQGTKS